MLPAYFALRKLMACFRPGAAEGRARYIASIVCGPRQSGPQRSSLSEISDQVGIMRSGRAHSLSNLLGLSLELGIVNIHRNALLPVCARLSGDIQNNRVGNSAFPDIGIRPRADGIKAPCSQARKGGHSPAIFIGI